MVAGLFCIIAPRKVPTVSFLLIVVVLIVVILDGDLCLTVWQEAIIPAIRRLVMISFTGESFITFNLKAKLTNNF